MFILKINVWFVCDLIFIGCKNFKFKLLCIKVKKNFFNF